MDPLIGQVVLDAGLVAVLVLVGVRLYRRRVRPAAAVGTAPETRTISKRQEADDAAAAHLTGMGFVDVRATGKPGELMGPGVTGRMVWRARPVGVDVLEALKAGTGAREAVLYSFAGGTRAALRCADADGIALFRLRVDGTATPENDVARLLEERAVSS